MLFILGLTSLHGAVPRPLNQEELDARNGKLTPLGVPARLTPSEEDISLRKGKLAPCTQVPRLAEETNALLKESRERSERANAEIYAFAQEMQLPLTPISINNTTDTPAKDAKEGKDTKEPKPEAKSSTNSTAKSTAGSAPDANTDTTPAPSSKDSLQVESDDGVYFDAEEGLIVYLKNVRVTDPRFSLSCDNELKVYVDMTPKEAKQGEEATTPADPTSPADKKKNPEVKLPDLKGLKFSGIKYISASGNVKIHRKDGKGQDFSAEADEVTYDGKTGEIILSGGNGQTLISGENKIVTTDPDSFIRIYGKGSVYIKGKRVITNLENDPKAKNPFSSAK